LKELTMKKLLSVAVGLALATGLSANSAYAELKVGDAAPDFELQGSDGKIHKLSDLKGTAVVLAWFPKAFTGG
jgi:thioredoxin-dependent peroxiredoxin